MEKVKIVLDADVLIHFSKAGRLSILPDIFPQYKYIILNVVYEELKTIQNQIDNQIYFLKNISIENFTPAGKMLMEYAMLTNTFGRGESACMAYCKYTNNVIGSSNLKDIKTYCTENKITFLTTLDFLYYAYTKNIMSEKECDNFIDDVIAKGSKLPKIKITNYTPNYIL